MEEKKVNIREMTMEDFEEVHALWMGIHGFGIRSIDDSKEGVERFIRRNPTTSMVACENDRIIGAILCGHDGRRGCLYHVCVHEDYRKQGIGQKMVEACLAALKREHVNKVNLMHLRKMTSETTSGREWDGRSARMSIIMNMSQTKKTRPYLIRKTQEQTVRKIQFLHEGFELRTNLRCK